MLQRGRAQLSAERELIITQVFKAMMLQRGRAQLSAESGLPFSPFQFFLHRFNEAALN